MTRYPLFDRSQLDLREIAERGHDLLWQDVRPLDGPVEPFDAPGFAELIDRIRTARNRGRPVIVFLGGHPIKLGLSRYLIDLIERRIITHLATNGAGLIHDFELALFGGTSEDVAKWIKVGQFGLWRETSRLNDVIREAANRGEGLGEAVGRVIAEGCREPARVGGLQSDPPCPPLGAVDLVAFLRNVALGDWPTEGHKDIVRAGVVQPC